MATERKRIRRTGRRGPETIDLSGSIAARSCSWNGNQSKISASTIALTAVATDSDATLLVSIGPELGPQQKKAIEFLGATKKPFLHLWSSIPQPGRLAHRFLELHKVEVLNVVGSPKDDEEATGAFIRSVFDTMILSTHL